MMTPEGSWSEPYTIRVYETDITSRLRMDALFDIFQEMAWRHVVELSLDYKTLSALGYAWYLSRARVRVHRLPVWGESGTIETWHATTDGLMFVRDFRLTDTAGRTVIEAATGWLLIDTTAFRPHAADALPVPLPPNNRGRALDEPMKKIVPPRSLASVYERRVYQSEIDVNQHVNNARYLAWVFDCYEEGFLRTHLLRALQVNYVGETALGDTVALSRGEDPASPLTHYVEGVSAGKGSRVVQALLTWVPVTA
ncbi:MAG TPA: acyl-ACP thioesterase domain-containing protein [Bacteroidota bacterium]|nr:acyl-ACP thioesterase domain-containing protein [Bacteroidota bacterium]